MSGRLWLRSPFDRLRVSGKGAATYTTSLFGIFAFCGLLLSFRALHSCHSERSEESGIPLRINSARNLGWGGNHPPSPTCCPTPDSFAAVAGPRSGVVGAPNDRRGLPLPLPPPH